MTASITTDVNDVCVCLMFMMELVFFHRRFGHSMVRDDIILRNVLNSENFTQFQLHKEFFNSELYFNNEGQGTDEIILGKIHLNLN